MSSGKDPIDTTCRSDKVTREDLLMRHRSHSESVFGQVSPSERTSRPITTDFRRYVNLRPGTTKHGESNPRNGRTPEYYTWISIRQRCLNPGHPRFKDYGGRGISVCARWSSFQNFLSDMGRRPPGLTIERINNDGNYEPTNCTWATYAQQAANKRKYKRHNSTPLSSHKPSRSTSNSPRIPKTHCPLGHEYTPENTYVNPSGGRACRVCLRSANARYYQRTLTRGGSPE